MEHVAQEDLLAALAGGPLTLEALHARLGGPDREALGWALDDAVEAGAVTRSGGACDADGLCASTAPLVVALSPAAAPPPASPRAAAPRGPG